MVKWIGEWAVITLLIVLGALLMFVLWAVWPLLPQRVPAEMLMTLSTEGLLAMGTLLVVVLGFGKLVFSK